MNLFKIILLFFPLSIGLSFTQTFAQNSTYSIGDEVESFLLKDINDKSFVLNSSSAQKGVIVIFISNYCPFAKSYEDRIVNIGRTYEPKGFKVVLINPNNPADYEEESNEKIRATIFEKGLSFTYLLDPKQTITKRFGAVRTPQVFVLEKSNNKLNLAYSGLIDDSPTDPAGVSRNYLEDALKNILNNNMVPTPTTKVIGCAIRWK